MNETEIGSFSGGFGKGSLMWTGVLTFHGGGGERWFGRGITLFL